MGCHLSSKGKSSRPTADDDVIYDALGGFKAGEDACDEGLLRIRLVSLTCNQCRLIVALTHELVVVSVGKGGGHASRCQSRVAGRGVCKRCTRDE